VIEAVYLGGIADDGMKAVKVGVELLLDIWKDLKAMNLTLRFKIR
jgi:hypothetical protein